ncbi:MAG TPA: alpha/beta hydrolase [Actinocrinis sp.]|jgi:dienelactone hydrolase
MHSVTFTAETSSDGVIERDFTVGEVTGALWSPAEGRHRAPLVLVGHGGGMHRKSPAVIGRAYRLVTGSGKPETAPRKPGREHHFAAEGGFTVAAIDAPGHGGRPRTAQDEQEIAALYRARRAGEPEAPIIVRYNADLAERAVPEWRATLDALQELPEIGADGPVGYWGIGVGTAIGIPLVADEPRITAAVFGPHWPDALAEPARRITVPVEFDLQWDDEHIPREAGLALFDAFASQEKTLHANAGKHRSLPRFEADSAVRFFIRHLRPAAETP